MKLDPIDLFFKYLTYYDFFFRYDTNPSSSEDSDASGASGDSKKEKKKEPKPKKAKTVVSIRFFPTTSMIFRRLLPSRIVVTFYF